jgi:hypothetical protein
MSARLTMVPSSATKAAVSGSNVFFIQKHCSPAARTRTACPRSAASPAVHQADLALQRGAGDLGVDAVHADARRTRGRLSCGASCAHAPAHPAAG